MLIKLSLLLLLFNDIWGEPLNSGLKFSVKNLESLLYRVVHKIF